MGFFDKLKSGIKGVAERATGGYGELTLELDRDRLKPGESFTFQVRVTAKSDFSITEVVATLQGEERVTFEEEIDGQTARASSREITLDLREQLAGEMEVAEGETRDFSGTFTIPEDAPISFESAHCNHRYKLSVRVDVPRAKDLTEDADLKIYTEGPAEAQQHQLDFVEPGQRYYLKLGAKDTCPVPGQTICVSGLTHAGEPLQIEEYEFVIESVEELLCNMSEENEDGERQNLGSREITWSDTLERVEREPFDLSKSQMDFRTIEEALPEELPASYTGPKFKMSYRARMVVRARCGEPVEALLPLTVHGARPAEQD